MRRTLLVSVASSAFVALGWLRLEEPREGSRVALVLAVALAPALLPRTRLRLAAALPALVLGAAVAFDASPRDVPDRVDTGVHAFYDVALPFDPAARPEMHGLVLVAVLAFALALSLAVAERRAVAAAGAFVAGAGWPVTLLPGGAPLGRGALILAGALLILASLRAQPLRAPGRVVVSGGAVVVAALVTASFPAVARDQIADWETWDPFLKTRASVGVQYVWDSDYTGIEFPSDATNLLEIAASEDPSYWRATTLDVYRNDRWLESLAPATPLRRNGSWELTADSDLPQRAKQRAGWLEQQVRVLGLRDTHLVGAPVPVAYDVEDGSFAFSGSGIAEMDGGTRRGYEYTVWSFASSPSPRRLAAAPASYGHLARRYFRVEHVFVPQFGDSNRHARMLALLRPGLELGRYGALYEIARRVGGSSTPYGAAVKIETWLRTSSDFVYEEQPARAAPGVPPLVDFVTRTREGYCQQYAGAMALMLRFLGIPARVAAGFTSGQYDQESKTWTVTDRNAHTWVEAWFPGFGWLSFDPTPGRGRLSGPYTSASLGFRGREALEALGRDRTLGVDGRLAIQRLDRLRARERALESGGVLAGEQRSEDSRGDETLALVLLAALLAAATIAALKIARRRLRYARGGARGIAAACRQELSDFLRDQRVDVRPAATLAEVGESVRGALAIEPRRFVAAASAARFGPEVEADEAARAARRELRVLKRALRARLSAGRRLRGLVSLRSLRA